MRIDQWDCRTGGSYRYIHSRDGEEYGFHGCFHEVRPNELIVQTFTFEGMPDGVALEKLVLEDLGNGRTRLTATSLVDSFADRDGSSPAAWTSASSRATSSLDELLARAEPAGRPTNRRGAPARPPTPRTPRGHEARTRADPRHRRRPGQGVLRRPARFRRRRRRAPGRRRAGGAADPAGVGLLDRLRHRARGLRGGLPGRSEALHLVVDDIERARAELVGRGVEVGAGAGRRRRRPLRRRSATPTATA